MKRFFGLLALLLVLFMQGAGSASSVFRWQRYCAAPFARGATLENPAFEAQSDLSCLTRQGEAEFISYASGSYGREACSVLGLSGSYLEVYERSFESMKKIVVVRTTHHSAFEREACSPENDGLWTTVGDFEYLHVQGYMAQGAMYDRLVFRDSSGPRLAQTVVQEFGPVCVAGVIIRRVTERKGIFVGYPSGCGNGFVRIFTVIPVVRERIIEKPVIQEKIVEKRVEVPVIHERIVEKPVIQERVVEKRVEVERWKTRVKTETRLASNPFEELPLNRNRTSARLRVTPGAGTVALGLLHRAFDVAAAPRTNIAVGGATVRNSQSQNQGQKSINKNDNRNNNRNDNRNNNDNTNNNNNVNQNQNDVAAAAGGG